MEKNLLLLKWAARHAIIPALVAGSGIMLGLAASVSGAGDATAQDDNRIAFQTAALVATR
jgi:hypothetical protein